MTRRICRYASGALFYYHLVNFHWLDNQPPLRLRVPARSNGRFAVGGLGTGDRVASLVWGRKIAPSHVQAAVPQRKQRADHKQNEGFKQRGLGRDRFGERRPAGRQLPDAVL